MPDKIDIYIANPYSHKDPAVQETRYLAAVKYLAYLSVQGLVAFSPIVHSHPPATLHEMPGDWAFWEKIDRIFVSLSNEVHVLKMDGWDQSTGVRAEIEMAKKMGIPVFMVNAETYDHE